MSEGNPTKEGRQRVFYVKPQTIMDWLNGDCDTFIKHRLQGLPSDAYVSSINWDWQRKAFCFTVDSLEFDPVPHGDMIPEIPRIIESAKVNHSNK